MADGDVTGGSVGRTDASVRLTNRPVGPTDASVRRTNPLVGPTDASVRLTNRLVGPPGPSAQEIDPGIASIFLKTRGELGIGE